MTADQQFSVINQAIGMVAVQAGCSVGAASVLLEAQAAAGGQDVADIARLVVSREFRF